MGSARSDTKNAGLDHQEASANTYSTRTPALHAILSGSQTDVSRSHSERLDQPHSLAATPIAGGEEVIFRKLKKMASLAGLLTKMIDETKSTILSPQPKTPARQRGSAGTASTSDFDISPGLLQTPVVIGRRTTKAERESEESGEVSMVSAAYSLDLSGSAKRDGSSAETVSAPIESQEPSSHEVQSCVSRAERPSDPGHPSPAQVENMYNSFLLSQKVFKSGSGYLSPTAPSTLTTTTIQNNITNATGKGKPRSLAALFASSSSTTSQATFEQLLRDTPGSPVKSRAAAKVDIEQTHTPITLTIRGGSRSSPKKSDLQRSTGKARKLARLFRKQS